MPVARQGQHRRRRRAGTRGSRFFATASRTRTPRSSRRLRAAGAVIVGKVALHEFAYGATTDNPHFGACRNPWDTEPRARRLERRLRRRARRRPVPRRARHRHRRLRPHPGGAERRQRACGPTLRAGLATAARSRSAPRSTRSGRWRATIADVAEMLAAIAGYDRDDPHAVEHPFDDPRRGLARRRRGPAHRAAAAASSSRTSTPPSPSNAQAAARRPRRPRARRSSRSTCDGADEPRGIATLLIRAEAPPCTASASTADPGLLRRGRAAAGWSSATRSPVPTWARAMARRMREWRVRHAAGLRRRGPAADADDERDGPAASTTRT